jgi:hypothetical protein
MAHERRFPHIRKVSRHKAEGKRVNWEVKPGLNVICRDGQKSNILGMDDKTGKVITERGQFFKYELKPV